VSPENVIADFETQLAELERFYTTGFVAFNGNKTNQSILTEHSLLAVAVAWEGFVSDLFIAYINRDATRFKEHLKNSFETTVLAVSTPKRVYENYVSLNFPIHIKKAEIHALADGIGNNITFPNFESLESKASTWLVGAHASKFAGLSSHRKAVVDSLISLRNHIAHRSQRSLDAMNDTLAKGVLYPTGLQRGANKFHNVGAWLKANPVGRTENRFAIIMTYLSDIAACIR